MNHYVIEIRREVDYVLEIEASSEEEAYQAALDAEVKDLSEVDADRYIMGISAE